MSSSSPPSPGGKKYHAPSATRRSLDSGLPRLKEENRLSPTQRALLSSTPRWERKGVVDVNSELEPTSARPGDLIGLETDAHTLHAPRSPLPPLRVPLSALPRQTDPGPLPGKRRKSSSELWKLARAAGQVASVYSEIKIAKKTRELAEKAADDGLGEGWEKRAWVPPSRETARSRAVAAKFIHGKAPLLDTTLEQAEELGVGVVIYFRILYTMACYFSAMSILVLPSIFLSRNGTYMAESGNTDFFQMLTLTLGNVNVYNSTVIPAEMINRDISSAVRSGECVDCIGGLQLSIMGMVWTLSAEQIGAIFVSCDIASCVLFVILIARLSWIIAKTVSSAKHTIQASNYAVFVTGLPPTATEHDVRKHFSERFDMIKVLERRSSRRGSLFRELAQDAMRRGSWLLGINTVTAQVLAGEANEADDNLNLPISQASSRSPASAGGRSSRSPRKPTPQEVLRRLRKPRPVVDTSFPGDEDYRGGWVAEVSLAHSNGEALRRYMRSEKDHQRMTVARARVQQYSVNTPYMANIPIMRLLPFGSMRASGASERKRSRALRRAHELAQKIQQRNTQQSLPALMAEKRLIERCCGAFVLFNNHESQLICLSAYEKSNSVLGRYLQPKDLRMTCAADEGERGGAATASTGSARDGKLAHSLCVEQAPNPSNILWENLHCSAAERLARGLATQLFTLILLALSTYLLYRLFNKVDEIKFGAGESQGGGDEIDASTRNVFVNIVEFAQILDLPMTGGLLSIVIMNHILRVLLRWLQKFERPLSLTKAESTLATKMFVSEFLNTAVVILLAAGAQNLIESGFSYEVYTSVGQDIMYAIVYIAIFPHLYRLLGSWIWRPFQRWRCTAKAATQMEMDRLYAGPTFRLGDRYSDILLTLFVSLSYSGGMPILLPCAALAFWAFYSCDWYLLLRYYSKPAMYDEKLAQDFCSFFPYSLLLHALGSVLAFGNGVILPTMSNAPLIWITEDSSIVLPSFHLRAFVAAIVPLMFISFYPQLILRLWKCGKCKMGPAASTYELDPIFTGATVYPSYTGVYFQVVDPNRRLTDEQWELEKEMGIAQVDNGIIYRAWKDDGEFHGVRHRAGQKRNTWECVHDYSYRITTVLRYRRAVGLMTRDLNVALQRHFGNGKCDIEAAAGGGVSGSEASSSFSTG